MSLLNYYAPKNSGVKKNPKKRQFVETTDNDDVEENDRNNDDTITSIEPSNKRIKLNDHNNNNENQSSSTNENNNDSNDNNKQKEEKEEQTIESVENIDNNKVVKDTTVTKKKETKTENEEKIEVKTVKTREKISYHNCYLLLHSSWQQYLNPEFKKPYFIALSNNLKAEESRGAQIFPRVDHVFRAFELCQWSNLKVVLLGQDPYHDDGQAEGLCFSVPPTQKIPSSLRNMYKEACDDVKITMPKHGHLVQWATQGVLLLNTALTVRAHEANSHQGFGWLEFTDNVIRIISREHKGVVFILWGKQAQLKEKMIDGRKHRVVKSAHPSGLSASKGFYGSKPYSKTNKFLKDLGKTPINWQIN